MPDERYRNRELDAKHDEIMKYLNSLDAKMEKGFEGVYSRQDETNGRVSKSEVEIAKIKTRTATAVGIITLVIIPIALAVANIYLG